MKKRTISMMAAALVFGIGTAMVGHGINGHPPSRKATEDMSGDILDKYPLKP